MIAKLFGVIDTVFNDKLLVNVNGVCYEVLCSSNMISRVSANQQISLWIEHIFRAEMQLLCGFETFEEKTWFKEITSVQGVGVKVALALFSAFPLKEIIYAIQIQDKNILTKADGVGKKVSERIILELKNSKLLKNYLITEEPIPSKTQEAIEALVSLGFDNYVARKTVLRVMKDIGSDEEVSSEKILKESLSMLNRN